MCGQRAKDFFLMVDTNVSGKRIPYYNVKFIGVIFLPAWVSCLLVSEGGSCCLWSALDLETVVSCSLVISP